MKVAVIGAGQFGVALAHELALSGHHVNLYGRDRDVFLTWSSNGKFTGLYDDLSLPRLLSLSTDMSDAIRDVDVILSVVPCAANRSIALQLAPLLNEGQKVVLCSKGFANERGDFLTDLWKRHGVPEEQLLVLSGPGFAKEIIDGQPTCVSLACTDKKNLLSVGSLFSGRKFRLYYTTDIIGVQVAGAMKNVFAILAGLVKGLGYGDNASAALLTMGLREMSMVVEALKGKRETLLGFSGVGDLLLTATSLQSRNTQFGVALAKYADKDKAVAEVGATIEGIATVEKSLALASRLSLNLPLVEGVHSVIRGYIKAEDLIDILFDQVREFETHEKNPI
ncbi:MAG: NAD(P)H-dependent glycerol-3-phosphate dehydrogenase [Pseudomonadota bacterium]|nr:NAD(P)H-dependent glycerol-3-phosphate dehydrogenase [Pseudomonadota bacterium]